MATNSPSTIQYWINYPDDKRINIDGYWMMFFDKDKLDEKWKLCLEKFKNRNLNGICKLSVSGNNSKSPIAFSKGVIIFHVLANETEKNIINYGENLLKHIDYTNTKDYMYYKTLKQTYNGCTMTGSPINHEYKIKLAL